MAYTSFWPNRSSSIYVRTIHTGTPTAHLSEIVDGNQKLTVRGAEREARRLMRLALHRYASGDVRGGDFAAERAEFYFKNAARFKKHPVAPLWGL